MDPQPNKLALITDDCLQIDWSNGEIRRYTVSELRDHCPCATCREKRKAEPPPATSLPILQPAETQPLRIARMEPMGHYAYAIHFSDGHNTGLYTLELLAELGSVVGA